ncbi:trichohyalin-like isoform X2 [Oncorhynchus mykiss]|uniref:trichohyalin-like isoform X2 n=1 Tax=Oncorhynchus mykiss TaxID=8022 RepID=UPI0018783104|nr:trichohyalin-like isoform X2 [Oncorhynchus mykiss]
MHPMDTVEDVRNIQQSLWELHTLLTDLPDDMLEDSRDSSSLDLDCSACSNTDTHNRAKLCEVNGEMVAVQDCYISLCKDEDRLEENLQGRRMDEEERRENEMRSWAQRFEADARRQRPTETQESSSQTDLTEKEEKACQTSSSERTKAAPGCTMEELDTRLWEQKLQREADLARRRAVEDAGKRVQRELQEKHLEDMAKQVEGAVSRVYSRWLQDVPSLPGYKATLQREREKWEKVQEKHVQQQMSLVLTVAEERRQEERPRSSGQVQRVEEMHRCSQLEEKDLKTEVEEVAHLQSQVAHLQSQVAHLQSQVAHLQSQLDREREEKAALLKAEMAAARASWNRDKQQEISSLQAFQEEQLKRARDEAQGEVELLLQKEAELQQALRDQEEDWRRQEESRGQEHRQAREEMLQELQAGLKEVQTMLLKGGAHKEKENGGEVEGRWRTSGSIKELLMSTCKYLISKAVAQAKIEWKRISEEGLGRVLKERRERQEKELNQIHNDHEVALWKENLQELEEMKRCAESSGYENMTFDSSILDSAERF